MYCSATRCASATHPMRPVLAGLWDGDSGLPPHVGRRNRSSVLWWTGPVGRGEGGHQPLHSRDGGWGHHQARLLPSVAGAVAPNTSRAKMLQRGRDIACPCQHMGAAAC